jgi:hypothetical protein
LLRHFHLLLVINDVERSSLAHQVALTNGTVSSAATALPFISRRSLLFTASQLSLLPEHHLRLAAWAIYSFPSDLFLSILL